MEIIINEGTGFRKGSHKGRVAACHSGLSQKIPQHLVHTLTQDSIYWLALKINDGYAFVQWYFHVGFFSEVI